MTQTHLLNLDELATPSKAIVIKGISHEMHEVTVQEFIDRAKRITEQKAGEGEKSAAEMVEEMVEVIKEAFPTVNTDDLRAMKFGHLTKIMDFIARPPEEIEKQVAAASGNAAA